MSKIELRFKKKSIIFDVVLSAMAIFFSVGTMIYGVWYLGIENTWNELILNIFYIACLVLLMMYFFNCKITKKQFHYWSSLCVGATVLLRDVLFSPPLSFYPLHLICLTLSVFLLLMLTYFYARKDWKTYSKRNLWAICIIDMIIAGLYTYDICISPVNEYTNYVLTEIWIRPTITYAIVACFVSDTES